VATSLNPSLVWALLNRLVKLNLNLEKKNCCGFLLAPLCAGFLLFHNGAQSAKRTVLLITSRRIFAPFHMPNLQKIPISPELDYCLSAYAKLSVVSQRKIVFSSVQRNGKNRDWATSNKNQMKFTSEFETIKPLK